MGYNKIPLALRYNDTTNNAEGLIEFQLNLSDVGDVCSSTPSQGQALVWSGGSDGSWCPSTLPAGGGGGTPTLPGGNNGDLLINTGEGTTYLASAASDAGIMQLDPYFDANDEGAVAQWDGTKLEVVFPDQLYMLVQAGEDLSKGDVVYVTGDTGSGRFIVAKADASNSSKMPAVGLVPAAISSGNNGKIVSFGRAIGLNTTGMTVGKPVYVATTAGGITKDKPTGATDLIQNIGIVSVVDGTNGVIKVTGVGRSNDIPVNVDVVGSATIGTNEFTQTNAILSNADQNSVMITDGASAVSSVSGASGSIVYFENDPPRPGLKTFANILSNENYTIQPGETYLQNVGPDNLNSAITSNQIPYAFNGTTFGGITTTTNGRTFMATDANLGDLTDVNDASPAEGAVLQRTGSNTWTHRYFEENSVVITDSASAVSSLSGASGSIIYFEGATPAPGLQQIGQIMQNAGERVEDHNIEDLANVSEGDGFEAGHVLVYQTGDGAGFTPFASSIFIQEADSIDHGGLIGLGDDDHTQYVLADGTRAITGDLSTVGVSATSGSVATTPTTANHIANKSYVDSQIPTPSYFQALASGTLTLSADATEYDLGWSTSGTYAITDPAGNLEVQGGDSQGNNINVSGDGVYQIDCSVQTTNTTNGGRVGATIRIYRDIGDGDGFTEISELRSANYASRGIENILTGTTHLNTLISLNDGDKLKFTIMRNTYTGTPNVTSDGTYLRIIKIA